VSVANEHQREALRQQLLLRALWRDNTVAAVQGWLREDPQRAHRGLNAYAATAGANAERALALSFPTVAALVGDASFGLLARAYRLAHPPVRGDLAWLGQHFPGFIEADPQLADVPYLADVARLDALLDHAERAADVQPQPQTLLLLQQLDPAEVALQLAPGAALLRSRWPVVSIRDAHQGPEAPAQADPFAAARDALERGEAQCALVWRQGFKPRAAVLGEADAGFMEALLQGHTLGGALAQAGPHFEFEPWLLRALSLGWLLAARRAAPEPFTSTEENLS
jgi:hypothetical protein